MDLRRDASCYRYPGATRPASLYNPTLTPRQPCIPDSARRTDIYYRLDGRHRSPFSPISRRPPYCTPD
jgi:hypothetical protein